MKILGLIVEYNPFHNGHLYHIEESLRITGADKAIVVMSGDFVQRGTPAIIPKHIRAEMALRSGVSAVIELPVRYATGSAEFFATGAVSLLHQLGCVDAICFGSESGNLDHLSQVAEILIKEPPEFQEALQKHLRSGSSFPLARQKAMEEYLSFCGYEADICNLLAEPNNILGIEYLKALRVLGSPIKPYTITRKASHYHDTELQESHSSASAIRKQIQYQSNAGENLNSTNWEQLLPQVPDCCYQLMKEHYKRRYPIYTDDFSLLLHNKLLNETKDSLMKYQDMTPELANRINNLCNSFVSFEQFADLINSKNMTYSRMSRILLHIILNITERNTLPESDLDNKPWIPYIHLLGFRRSDADILTLIKKNSTTPILTKLTNAHTLCEYGQFLLDEDILASNLYESVVTNKYRTPFIHELEKSLVLL